MTSPISIPKPPWLGRALIEAGLIVFAVVLGFIVNEWREDVADRRAAREAMSRVVAEIESNITQLERVATYHEAVAARIGDRLAEIDASETPVTGTIFGESARIMPQGINAPGLSRFAWTHAQQHGRLDVLPYEVVAETARVYDMQANGVESTWRQIVDLLFAGPEVMEEADLRPVLQFTAIGFTELASQERYLIAQYRSLLEDLREAGIDG
ncbi:hypothetical protein RMQ97_11100 [Maricaulis sp. D1M11]|uniref:hypothetical protein n=1 Tax=Maricaulis sp. D1M11 TaxID=3076117 RepID=UPI0039B5F7CD